MLTRLLCWTLFLLVFLVGGAPGASEKPELEALEILRRGFAASEDFSAEVVQEKRLSLMKRNLVSRGLVRFKKPDLFYLELFPPHPSRMLLKGNVMTVSLPDQGALNQIVLPPDQSLDRWFAYLEKPVATLPEGMQLRAQRRGNSWTLEIRPSGPGTVARLTLDFDRDGKVSRLVIQERNQDSTTLVFSKFRRNVGLSAKDFRVPQAKTP